MTDRTIIDDNQVTMMRACLVLCARRLRRYENDHLVTRSGTASLYERQKAEEEAETDGTLAEMAENLVLQYRQAEDAYIMEQESLPG